MARKWAAIEAYSTQLKHSWRILKAYLKQTWSILEAYLQHTWGILEAFLKHAWSLLDTNLKHTWGLLEAYLTTLNFTSTQLTPSWPSNKPRHQKRRTQNKNWFLVKSLVVLELCWWKGIGNCIGGTASIELWWLNCIGRKVLMKMC